MRKILFALLSVIVISSCGDSKKEEEKKPETTETPAPVATGNDAALITWLSGKMLVSTKEDPATDMWNNLKLNADGTCTDKDNASAKWTVKEGKFIFESATTLTKEMEKKDETMLVFKGAVGDDSYLLKPIQ